MGEQPQTYPAATSRGSLVGKPNAAVQESEAALVQEPTMALSQLCSGRLAGGAVPRPRSLLAASLTVPRHTVAFPAVSTDLETVAHGAGRSGGGRSQEGRGINSQRGRGRGGRHQGRRSEQARSTTPGVSKGCTQRLLTLGNWMALRRHACNAHACDDHVYKSVWYIWIGATSYNLQYNSLCRV